MDDGPASEPTEVTCQTLLNELSEHDIVIDGGNSNYKESQLRAARFARKRHSFLRCRYKRWHKRRKSRSLFNDWRRTSNFEQLAPLFKALAVDEGFMYTGLAGSGHF